MQVMGKIFIQAANFCFQKCKWWEKSSSRRLSPTFYCLKRKKHQFVWINLVVENCLNSEFCWTKVLHSGFKIQSLTWILHDRSQEIYSQLAHLLKHWGIWLRNIPFLAWRKSLKSCKEISFLVSEDLTWSLVTGPVLSLRELSRDLKNTDFHYWNLGKITKSLDFLVKHYINIYMRI